MLDLFVETIRNNWQGLVIIVGIFSVMATPMVYSALILSARADEDLRKERDKALREQRMRLGDANWVPQDDD